jgi:hypothetical protein
MSGICSFTGIFTGASDSLASTTTPVSAPSIAATPGSTATAASAPSAGSSGPVIVLSVIREATVVRVVKGPVGTPVIHEIVICATKSRRVGVRAPSVFVFDVPDQSPVAGTVTVDEKHDGKKLILGAIASLLPFNISGHVRVGGNFFEDGIDAVRVSADVAPQPFCIRDKVLELLVVLVVS